ncbi:UDP-N-acetylmuramoyl-L-alanine--D-glutamate ligase [Virgibacillus sp. LDC-1]|uniref:UDP-N-acetylmuramoyl-L-alanine--D-glutamate ligase n=1 Tax=Virgibacillus sp. LDC-1 TaxID=3039856 RepID=UPI0024DDFA92|nr:UDP-N-acetylmuramoyl-L-alanine--D-glutamate ligase [Virgibacillus sp. LDC-1]
MKKLAEFPYKHILVLGLAKSGTAAAKVLLLNDKQVRVNDMKAKGLDPEVVELKNMGAEVILGSHPLSTLTEIDVVVKNPGIPYDNPIVAEAVKRNIPIITEVELAGYIAEDQIIGITGSNGKTTTTMLITEMLKASNQGVQVAGNIGFVATEVAQALTDEEKLVLELSSFQLQGTSQFRPHIAVLLNIFEAHLDYHKTMDDYVMAKCNIYKNQRDTDMLVYNADDPILSKKVEEATAQKIPFSVTRKLADGAWIDENSIYFKSEKVMDRHSVVLVGEHNMENILAAVSAAKLGGATNKGIQKVLRTFSGVEHRLQFVDVIQDRQFYNDSKATNMLATKKALASFQQPVILLAGGLDRGNSFDDLIPYLENVKAMVLFGQTAAKLSQTALKAGIEKQIAVKNMQEAVKEAYSLSDPGDVILLSPACASWDQYRTFEERGDMFMQAVHTLK